jgi:glycosyltransferase involved in cell wall biosynthesis/SAM-dependent methyltransferase
MTRVAFFSPLPPSRSGIADYSEALAASLGRAVELEIFADAGRDFDPARCDVALYHVGNNPHHAFVYEAALRHPGVVVMHEANLHHLVADLTIRRGDWDGYLRECEYHGGEAALAFARRVRALEVGPDYEGLPMTRRILETARGVVVHSRFMEAAVRAQGYRGPVAVIPHGAWIPAVDRHAFRHRLGLDETAPLVGIFGFLKPYKRIPESLRAFRRLVKLEPAARLILVGEPHPELPLGNMIRSLGLEAHARVIGFAPIDDFVGYLAACDIVLNLRYPTVGESSGTLLRSLGLGRAVLVSEVGAFAELPDEAVLKVPVGAGEEDVIFEYLNLLVSQPDVARALGENARDYVTRECNWDAVANLYARFLEAVASGTEWPVAPPPPPPTPEPPPLVPPDLESWAQSDESRVYIATHRTRLVKTLDMTPAAAPGDRVLEMGAYLQITPALRTQLRYEEVRGCYYGPAGQTDHREVASAAGERFACEVDLFDAERDPFPYPDGHFATVLCCELIEHLREDPMHLMAEVNRILRPGGHLVLTTPNVASLRAVAAILHGYHPGFFHSYIRPPEEGREPEARHNREYAPREIHLLLENAGFEVARLETGEFLDAPHPEHGWVRHLLRRYKLAEILRGEGIYALGRKTGPVRERYPGWLYT